MFLDFVIFSAHLLHSPPKPGNNFQKHIRVWFVQFQSSSNGWRNSEHLELFCCLHQQSLPLYPVLILDWELFRNLQNFHPNWIFNNFIPIGQKMALQNWQPCCRLEGKGPQTKCLWSATNQKSLCYDITVGLLPLEHWGVCCYDSIGNKVGRTGRKLPLSCG
jgi:hypothetical protein